MKILIVNPTRLDENGIPVKYRMAYFPPLIFAMLNRLTPPHHAVEFVNDVVEQIDFDRSFDLVAITVMTIQSDRAYQIADTFRNRGVKVVMGGIHVTILPEEAGHHADAIVVGEADNLWERILDDCERGRLKGVYREDAFPDLQNLVLPKWEGINMKIYPRRPGWKFPVISTFTTRGCPLKCDFCSVSRFFGNKYRVRPVEHVMKEIDANVAMGAKYLLFLDDNIAFNPEYSRELFRAVSKKNITWMSQASTTIAKKPDLLRLAAESGCLELFIGLESINTKSLESMNKKFNKIDEYGHLLKIITKAGIMPMVSIIIGFDEDTPGQLRQILEFLKENRVYYATFSVLTPFPGTAVHDRLKREGRINHYRWSEYTLTNVVFRPKNFTEEELQEAFWRTYQEFYSFKNYIPHALYGLWTGKRGWSVFLDNLFYQYYFRSKVVRRDTLYSSGFGKRIG